MLEGVNEAQAPAPKPGEPKPEPKPGVTPPTPDVEKIDGIPSEFIGPHSSPTWSHTKLGTRLVFATISRHQACIRWHKSTVKT